MPPARRLVRIAAGIVILAVVFAAGWVVAKSGVGAGVDPASLGELERQFTERLRDSSLVGRFTVDGREDRAGAPDRYDISRVTKVSDGHWRFDVRMRHGGVDVSLPIVLPVSWVGDTPMVMLTDFSIPTLGTFSARVFFHGDRYAGTWQNDRIGGQMFGRIEKQKSPSS